MAFTVPQANLTREEQDEIARQVDAEQSLLAFMSYCWRRPSEPLQIGPHTRAISSRLTQAAQDFRVGKSTYLEVVVPFRHGKALALDTPIATPTGWTTMGAIAIGDRVYGSDGTLVTVIAKSPVWHDREVYRVSIDSGRDVIIADSGHLWRTKLDRRQHWKLYDTRTVANPRRFSCPLPNTPVLLTLVPDDLPIPPYTLGYWLGDGSSQRGSITTGDRDMAFIRAQVEADGFPTRMQADGRSFGALGLQRPLRVAGLLHNKHIPSQYLRASPDARLALLQGLMDSDGEVGGTKPRTGRSLAMTAGQATFGNTNRQLALDVLELVRTLGVKASMTECRARLNGRDCGPAYKVTFYMQDCCRLMRKRCRTRDATKFGMRSMRAEPAGRADTVCIQVDAPDGMFLAGRSFVQTHNSDQVSRYLPAWFLGQFPDAEVMETGYAADLVQGFSRDVKGIISDERYGMVFSGTTFDPLSNNAGERRIAGRTGKLYAIGRGGAAAGRGCALLIVDDMLKNREEAESQTVRDSAWASFTNDFMTRLAPVHIVVVCQTRWHVDDLIGRIHERTTPGGESYDPSFPHFERLHFGARVEDGYLHEARFGRQWYEAQYATLGTYGSSALLDGSPVVRGGAFLSTDGIQWVADFPVNLAWVRCWDLASSEVEVAKTDPDWTVGGLVAVSADSAGVETIHLDDFQMVRAEATRRDKLIRDTAKRDAARGIPQYIEAVAGYKDAYTTLRDVLAGVAVVHRVKLGGDKVVRAGRVEPHFESGHVRARAQQPWQPEVVRQVGEFPGGVHDDVVDVITSGYVAALSRRRQLAGLGSAIGKGAR